MRELKPCPFCGSTDIRLIEGDEYCWCKNQCCPIYDYEIRIDKWESRSGSPEIATLREQVKVLREALEDGRDDLGMWLSVALEDPKTCISFKTCIQVWMDVTFEALEQTKPKEVE